MPTLLAEANRIAAEMDEDASSTGAPSISGGAHPHVPARRSGPSSLLGGLDAPRSPSRSPTRLPTHWPVHGCGSRRARPCCPRSLSVFAGEELQPEGLLVAWSEPLAGCRRPSARWTISAAAWRGAADGRAPWSATVQRCSSSGSIWQLMEGIGCARIPLEAPLLLAGRAERLAPGRRGRSAARSAGRGGRGVPRRRVAMFRERWGWTRCWATAGAPTAGGSPQLIRDRAPTSSSKDGEVPSQSRRRCAVRAGRTVSTALGAARPTGAGPRPGRDDGAGASGVP